jgi:hypothetical protein
MEKNVNNGKVSIEVISCPNILILFEILIQTIINITSAILYLKV